VVGYYVGETLIVERSKNVLFVVLFHDCATEDITNKIYECRPGLVVEL
jgi:hypothetical protein